MSSTINLLVFFFFISSSYSEPILVNNTCESHNLSSFEKLVFYSNELLKFDYILNLTGSAPFNMNKVKKSVIIKSVIFKYLKIFRLVMKHFSKLQNLEKNKIVVRMWLNTTRMLQKYTAKKIRRHIQ